ncbi:MAG: hypothetical protein FWC71_06920 [Defluviitaleaceae bacterium]|nr:hypothetical protein [Defluviitaleaceae bacterium]
MPEKSVFNYGKTPSAIDERMREQLTIKKHVLSIPFILGCVLITGSTIAGTWLNPTWDVILDAAFAAVHIIALWLLVMDAAGSSASHSKTLTALSMFKFSAVLSMIAIVIIYGILIFALLASFMSGFVFLFLLAFVGGIGYVMLKFYFFALFRVLNSIRYRIEQQKYTSLDGLWSFFVISYILIGLGLLMSLIALAGDGGSGMSFLVSAAGGIGIFLCLNTLRQYE